MRSIKTMAHVFEDDSHNIQNIYELLARLFGGVLNDREDIIRLKFSADMTKKYVNIEWADESITHLEFPR